MPVSNQQFSITGQPLTQEQQQQQNGNWFIPDTTGAFQFDDAIRRRFDSIDQMGQAKDAAVAAQAQAAAQQRMQAAQVQRPTGGYQAGQQFGGIQNLPNTVVDRNGIRGRLVDAVAQFKGTPYVWGGAKPGGFDCSGLIQYAYKSLGINMPRVSQQQAQQGRVVPFNQLQPGDLVGWGKSPATAHHIAVYAGNGMIWEAPRPGKAVQLRPLGQWSADNTEAFGIALNL